MCHLCFPLFVMKRVERVAPQPRIKWRDFLTLVYQSLCEVPFAATVMMVSSHISPVSWIMLIVLIYFQGAAASSLFRDDEEVEVATEFKPPPRPSNPLSEVLSVILQPLQYLSVALENILRIFVQLGQQIAVGINDKLTSILH